MPYLRPLLFALLLPACSGTEDEPAGGGAPAASDVLCGQRPGGSVYGEHVLRFEDAAGSIVVQLQRSFQGAGVGHSILFRLDGFALVHAGSVRCSSASDALDYVNTHHNFDDIARAELEGVRYELKMQIEPEEAFTLSATSGSGASVIEATSLIATGSPPYCFECPGDLPVSISEIMANNSSTHADTAGEYEPWVELFNPSSEDVDLTGWTLSDDFGDRGKWTLPSVTIPRHEVLVIFADADETQGALHASFELDPSGGEIVLSTASGASDGGFAFPAQRAGESLTWDWQQSAYVVSRSPTPGEPPSE